MSKVAKTIALKMANIISSLHMLSNLSHGSHGDTVAMETCFHCINWTLSLLLKIY